METYLERYLDGEHQSVWAELVGRGGDIREEPLYSDAMSVARVMMLRCRRNITLLVERLSVLHYRFVDPDEVWVPPDERHIEVLDALEQRFGPFPLVVRMWYEMVGSVNFMGAHPKLSKHHSIDWGGSDRLPCYGDPFVAGSHLRSDDTDSLLPFYINRASDEKEMRIIERDMQPPYGLHVGLDAVSKANESGDGPIAILVPNPGFDAPLIDSGYWAGTFFVTYLRETFKWGGFPGLKGGQYPGQQWDPAFSQVELSFLTKDLLPL